MINPGIPRRGFAVLALPLALLASGAAAAEQLPFRVAFADVPGLELIQAGRHDEAIGFIESRLSAERAPAGRDSIATLCGAYVLSGRFREALPVCDRAVAEDASDVAFNNRGVLRAHLGDVEGALADFRRVHVPDAEMTAFLARLREGSVRLMATDNLALAQELRAKRGSREDSPVHALRGAEIESLAN